MPRPLRGVRPPSIGDLIRFTVYIAAASAALICFVPSPASARSQPSLIWRISRTVFGPHARTAYCIARYESHWDPLAVSPGGGNWGVWQINVVHRRRIGRDWARIRDPWFNARVAYRISHGGRDWSAWATHGMCGV